jgi:hypothetical protein
VKSFKEIQPFWGCARAPDDVHLYVDGRAHWAAAPATEDAIKAMDEYFMTAAMKTEDVVEGEFTGDEGSENDENARDG